jgi:hypothetical protein
VRLRNITLNVAGSRARDTLLERRRKIAAFGERRLGRVDDALLGQAL